MILRTLGLILLASHSYAACALVQCAAAYGYAPVNLTTGAGDTIVVFTSYASGTNRNDTITDGESAYVHPVNVRKTVNGTGTGLDMSYALNVTAGAKTIAITGSTGDDLGITACAFSGVTGFSTSSSTYTNGTPTTTPTMAAFSTTGTSLVVVGYANETDGSEVTAGTGYTIDANRNSGHYDGMQYNLAVSAGSQTPFFTVSSNASWIMGAMAFACSVPAVAPAARRVVVTQ